MNVQEVNFEDILSQYLYATGAQEALLVLESKIDAGDEEWLRRMLRDYRERPVYDLHEIAFRDGVDDLMTFCNVVEYAVTGRLVIMQSPRVWSWGPLSRVLRNVHVAKYYSSFYRDRLPQLLLKRIDASYEEVEIPGAEVHSFRFLELDRKFVENHRTGCLLKLLDGFTIDGIRFADLTKHFESPGRVLDSLFKPEDSKALMDKAVDEFSQFLSFSGALSEELDEAEKFPLLQAEAWSRYAYWFEIIERKMSRRFGRIFDQFVTWEPPQDGADAAKEIQEFVAAAKTNLNSLFSKAYASRIDAILAKPDNSPIENMLAGPENSKLRYL